jgi:hemolysin activation/secretion protein
MKLLAASSAFLVLVLNPSFAFAADAVAPASDQAQAKFDVFEYRVLGNTVLSNSEIESTLYPRLGVGKTIDDVEQARAALEAFYHERGFETVFVDIPEQDVNDGVVRLKVSEGKLGRSQIAGTRYFSNRKIRAALPEAEANKVPHLPTLQAELAALNAQTPDRVVTPVLKAGSKPGTVDLTLNVHDEVPITASLELNNEYSIDTTPLRAIFMFGYNDMFGRLDSLSVQYQTAPEEPSEVDVWAASYTARLGERSKLSAFFVDSNSDVATVGDGGSSVNVLGKGNIYGLRVTDTLQANAAATHIFLGGLEYKDFTESIFSKSLVLTPISYLNASVGHTSAWRGESRQWTLASSANFGFRGQLNDPTEFRLKRSEGIPNYFLVRADGSVTQKLPWGMGVHLRAAGQYAVDSIVSNEQMSIAGADGVRGYLEAEVLGDIAIKSSLELATPRWKWFKDELQFEFFGFFDYGRMSRLNPLRDGNPQSPTLGLLLEPVNVTLTSAGVGFNLWAIDHVNGVLIWAYPFVSTPTVTGTREGDARVHFRVSASW